MFLGKPTETFVNAEKAVLEGMEAGLETAKAGNLCEDIANAVFAVLKKYGIEKTVALAILLAPAILLIGVSAPCLCVQVTKL